MIFRSRTDVQQATQQIVDQWGRLDIAFANVSTVSGTFWKSLAPLKSGM